MFQLTREEIDSVKSQNVTSPNEANLKSQFVTSSWGTLFEGQNGGARKLPYAFTEQGIYMLATVLRGQLAEQQSIFIMRAFREMKHFVQNNAHIFVEIDNIKKHLLESDLHQKEADKKIAEIFMLMDWKCGTGVFKSRLARAWSHAEGS